MKSERESGPEQSCRLVARDTDGVLLTNQQLEELFRAVAAGSAEGLATGVRLRLEVGKLFVDLPSQTDRGIMGGAPSTGDAGPTESCSIKTTPGGTA